MTRKTIRTESEAIKDIFEMHRYCRPMGSKAEAAFIERYLAPLGVEADERGNLIKIVGDSKVLWSSHTDTVHSASGEQRTAVGKGMILKLHESSKANCLGADCTAGIFIMREMIIAEVPGVYIFHYGEERGGIGSSFIRSKPDRLAGLDYAIAFDRYGKTSIITHQGGKRTCSDEFVVSMNEALGGGFKADDGGSFTDTANYTDYISECTNVSVGYLNQHSARETQDIRFLLDLRGKMLRFDEGRLVKARKPGSLEWKKSHIVPYSQGSWWDDDNWVPAPKQTYAPVSQSARRGPFRADSMAKMIQKNADALAAYFEAEGIDLEELEHWVFEQQGFVRR